MNEMDYGLKKINWMDYRLKEMNEMDYGFKEMNYIMTKAYVMWGWVMMSWWNLSIAKSITEKRDDQNPNLQSIFSLGHQWCWSYKAICLTLTSQFCHIISLFSFNLIHAILKMKLKNRNKHKPTTEPKGEPSPSTERSWRYWDWNFMVFPLIKKLKIN